MVVGCIVARIGRSRLLVGPCISCSLRSRVAPAPEILCFAPLSIVMRQEPLKKTHHSSINVNSFTHKNAEMEQQPLNAVPNATAQKDSAMHHVKF